MAAGIQFKKDILREERNDRICIVILFVRAFEQMISFHKDSRYDSLDLKSFH